MRYAILGFAVATATWVVTPGATARHAHTGGTQQDRWSWHGRLAQGKTLEIRGINGDVTADAASGNEIEVTALKHARRSDPDDVRIEVVEHDDGVTICAVYPSSRGGENTCAQGGGHSRNIRNNDVVVDFTVRVPRGVHFDGNTVNGSVEATGLSGDVALHTVNGQVRLETNGGDATAGTVNGSIEATVNALGSRPLRFSTVNGQVSVTLPGALSADLDAKTVNGSITSDFPISVQGRLSPRHLMGRIGDGGRALDLETVNGSIRIRRVP